MTKTAFKFGYLDTFFVGLLLVIFAGIIIHTPLTIWLGTFFPQSELLLKGWKEIILTGALGIAALLVHRHHRWDIIKNPFIALAGLYAIIHILLVPFHFSNGMSTIAGLMIDLRYVAFFALVVIAIQLYPQLRTLFIKVFIAGALIVCVFAVLQVFILPSDILAWLGYNDTTISPYLTVDENPDYVRVNSTLRGPNPLGAYAVIVLAVLAAYWLRLKRVLAGKKVVSAGVLAIAAIIALWASYSRSALIAAVIALGLILFLTIGRRLNKSAWFAVIIVIGAVAGGLIAARDTSFVSNVILHENEGTGANVSSNDGHVESLIDGLNRTLHQPLGGGIGSTGSASLYGDQALIIENQYLFIAHEVGWIGLAVFMILFVKIIWTAWQRRSDWLALAVFASGIGLAVIGLLLPVWVDDTVSIIWWGLAALVIGGTYGGTIHKKAKRTT